MSVLIGTHTREQVPLLLDFFASREIAARKIGEVSRVIIVDVPTPAELPVDLPYYLVKVVEDSSEEYHNYSVRQDLSIPTSLSPTVGSWGPARVIRRRAPWDVDRIQHPVTTFFRSERDGTGVDYYLPDSGCRFTHVEFGGRASIIFQPAATPNGDVWGHGTECASVAVGSTVGIARGATLFAARGQDNNGAINAFTMASALQACLDHYLSAPRGTLNRPAVCSLSFGKAGEESVQTVIIEDMIEAGIVVVGAAGNNGTTTDFFPAQFANVLAVGGYKMNDTPLYLTIGGSNWAPWVRITAPSEYLRVARVVGDNDYGLGSGTSYAAPVVAGVIACMLEGLGRRLTGQGEVNEIVWTVLKNATTSLRTAGNFPRNNTLINRMIYLNPRRSTPEIYEPTPEMLNAAFPTAWTVLQNPSFESGMSLWTEDNSQRLAFDPIIAATETTVLPTIDGLTGVCRFDNGTAGSPGWVLIQSTAIGIPNDKIVQANAVAGETITVTCGARSSKLTATPADLRAELLFTDEFGTFCGRRIAPFQTLPANNTAWQTLTFGPLSVPRLARSFQIRLYAERRSDIAVDNTMPVIVDAVSFAYGTGATTATAFLAITNPQANTLSGWTIVNGNWFASGGLFQGGARISAVVGHTIELFQDVSVQSGLHSRIDTGVSRVDFFWRYDTNVTRRDNGRVVLEFRSAGGTVLGETGSPYTLNGGEYSILDALMPAGTRTIRIRFIGQYTGHIQSTLNAFFSNPRGQIK